MRTTVFLSVLLGIWLPLQAASVSGELRKWHKVTLSFNGPTTSESATPNPFTNYRLDVTFQHAGSGKTYVVPGYYAADGNAANTSASSGNVWRTHFAPDETGTWTYQASFRSGTNVHAGSTGSGSSAGFFDGDSGSFTILDTDKTGRDLRGKGLLQYVGKHHLRFAGTGTYFMKAGVDSPENLLAYADFDGDFKTDGQGDDLIKNWQPHVADWKSGDPVWQGSKGKGLIGAINYLASEGLNSFSFLTMNINGDDKNVFPYIDYSTRDRLDVSRLDQWEIVFEHGTRNGMYLHFKTQETENELLLDSGNLGNQRKLYYRELIARFGHNLALNWNLGEEVNDASTSQKKAWAQYFHDVDPYHHHIVIHNGDSHFDLMGPDSELTGMSWQANASNFSDTFPNVLEYIERADAAGKPWVVACDEPGDASLSLRPDNDAGNSHTDARRDALWATFMAGGAGIEFYFGYSKPNSDLTCEDFRSRDSFWDYCRYAIQFFESGVVPFQDMSNHNELVSGSGDNLNRCLAKPGQSYLVQLRSGGTNTLNLSGATGSFRVRWLDPRNGGSLINGTSLSGGGTVSLGTPPNSTSQDWIALVDKTTGGTPDNQAPVVSAGPDRTGLLSGSSVTLTMSGSATDDGLPESGTLTTSWTRVSGPAGVSFATPTSPSTNASFSAAGTYVLRLTAGDGELSASDDVTVTITSSSSSGESMSFGATQDAYTENGTTRNLSSIRVESSDRKRIAYIQFDVQGIASATNAIVKLTESDDDSAGTMTIRLYAARSNNWSEDTITSSNAPGKGALLDTFTGDISDGEKVSFDASAFITGPGTYTLILEADSSSRDVAFGASEYSVVALRPELVITTGGTPPPNAAPVVNAGADQSATLSGSSVQVQLNGTASDDGLPLGSSLAVTWSRVSGPAAVSFSSSTTPSTQVTFSQAGSYLLRLTATDGALTSSDDVIVTVNPQPPANQPPVVNAGPDRTATLSGGQAAIALDGSATDDGLPAGSSIAVSWSRVSGPAAVTFSNPSSPDTNVTFTVAGTYVLRLSGTDGALTATDDATVVVSNVSGGTQTMFLATQDAYTENGITRNVSSIRVESSDRKRIAYIQFDVQGIASATNAIMKLTESDDDSAGTMTIRLYAALSNNWSEDTITSSNAPGKGALLDTFTGDISDGEEVSFDASAFITGPGTYTLILEADPSSRDIAFAATENSIVSARPELIVASGAAPPPNAAPVVNAGADQTAAMGSSTAQVQLNGTASDDGLPSDSSLAVTWSSVSGPAAVSFSSSNTPSTQVTFSQAGTYTLRLTATDGALTSSDDVIVTVNPRPPVNQPPVVNAGPDRTATLSGGQATLAIDGSASDDGLPAGSTLTVAWSRVSGPAAVTFSSPSSPDTNATFTAAGTYMLRLSGSDGTLTGTDDTTVVISSAPGGGTQTQFLPTHDAYTENGSNRNSSSLRIENTSLKRIAYLQFDLSAAVSPINSATLELTEDDDVSSGSMRLRLFAATSNAWTESSINGSNAPSKGAELDSVTGEISNDESVTFDVSALVTAPGIYSFILEADPSPYDVAFASSENATTSARPILRVTGGSTATAMALRMEAAPATTLPPAPIVSIQRMADRGIRVNMIGVAGQSYRVQRTSDLVHWETLKTVIAAEDGVVDFIDPDPTEFQAFYRLEWDD
jgi:hypothetical protein